MDPDIDATLRRSSMSVMVTVDRASSNIEGASDAASASASTEPGSSPPPPFGSASSSSVGNILSWQWMETALGDSSGSGSEDAVAAEGIATASEAGDDIFNSN